MSNWKTTVNKANNKAFTVPEGWSTEEEIAEDLNCPLPQVKEVLKPGIRIGDIERHVFSVWNEELQSKKRVTCYRPVSPVIKDGRKTRTKQTDAERVAKAIERHPDKTDRELTKVAKCRIGLVRTVRQQLKDGTFNSED